MPPFTLGHKLEYNADDTGNETHHEELGSDLRDIVALAYNAPDRPYHAGSDREKNKLNDMKVNDIAKSFDHGAADLLGAAMCVGMAQGIIIILGGTSATDGTVLNTILHSISNGMQNFPPVISAW